MVSYNAVLVVASWVKRSSISVKAAAPNVCDKNRPQGALWPSL
jgi:hypothetical protein